MSRRLIGVGLPFFLAWSFCVGASCARTVHDTEELPTFDASLGGGAGTAGSVAGGTGGEAAQGGAGATGGSAGAGAGGLAGQGGIQDASVEGGAGGSAGTGGGASGAAGTSTGGTGATGGNGGTGATGGYGGTGATGGYGGTGATGGTGGGGTCPTAGTQCGPKLCCDQRCWLFGAIPLDLDACCLDSTLGICGAIDTVDGGAQCTATNLFISIYPGTTCQNR